MADEGSGNARVRGLQQCGVVRPPGFGGAVEIVWGHNVAREFPVHVTETFGVCLKFGRDHAVVSDGQALRYPAVLAVCAQPAAVGFLSIDIAPHALPADMRAYRMRFVVPSASLDLRRFARELCSAEALLREQALAELIVALAAVDTVSGARSLMSDAPIRKARERLADDLDVTLSLDALAGYLGVNKFALIRRFREHTGTTPHRYRTLLRISRAKELLARGCDVAEVAHRVGFSDQAHLSRMFKHNVGITPGAFARATRTVAGVSALGARDSVP